MKKIIAAIGALLIFTGLRAQDTASVKKATTPQVRSNKNVTAGKTNADVKTAFPKKTENVKTAFPKKNENIKTAFPKNADTAVSKTVKQSRIIKN